MLHDEVVSQVWPGKDPITPGEYRASHLLESAAGRPFQTAFGRELFPGMFHKAGALFHSLISNHPFHNGNKRTAVLAPDHFLLANGYFPVLDDEEMYELARTVARYREEGISHEEVLRNVTSQIQESTITLRQLRKQVPPSEYKEILTARRLIRRDKLNRRALNRPG
jgi:death-on-curing family protein